jgi:hypothetical protein
MPKKQTFNLPTLFISKALLLCAVVALSGCSTYKPTKTADICNIFLGETDWYKAARKANKRWGTPIPLMMAIINQESSFRHNVRPDRHKFFFIPLPRRSSAYGYAQAQDPAWNDYRRDTGHWTHDRDKFGDAINFVGWYTDKSHKNLGLSKWDAPNQYLAYHEGWGGFKRGTYKKKKFLSGVAAKVKRQTATYSTQLKTCQPALDKAVKGWWPF